ncbi:MAG: efflux RND transporter periplasmic adaptor subunit [Arsenophonus endosymbiont of Dermacentor nuttalli]
MQKNRGVLPLVILLLSNCLILSACGDNSQQGNIAPPPPEVGIVTLEVKPFTVTTELPGRTSAYRIAEIRPQVSGIILKIKRNYKEGSDVKAGTSLYQIDPATYKTNYDSAKANLAKAKANAEITCLTVSRYKPLLGTNYISKQEYDTANANYTQALASLKAAEGVVETARINLEYTKVTAPISGHTSKSNVTEGALVSTGQTIALTTIQQLDPIYVDVTQSSDDYLRLKNEIASGNLAKESQQAPVSLKIKMNNGDIYTEKGVLQFSDVTVDESTGSITMRAIFPNPDKKLLPGMFVRTILEEGVKKNAILVPQQGVNRTPRGEAQVMIVNANNEVEVRTVITAQAIGNQWLITKGLSAGERVIIIGLQKIKPGMKVMAKETSLKI